MLTANAKTAIMATNEASEPQPQAEIKTADFAKIPSPAWTGGGKLGGFCISVTPSYIMFGRAENTRPMQMGNNPASACGEVLNLPNARTVRSASKLNVTTGVITMSQDTVLKIEPSMLVSIENEQVFTTSLQIAEAFEKQHKHILEAIENLECSDEFHEPNFRLMFQEVEIGNGAKRKSKYYQITRDGFTILAMGFTGKKAMAFKEAYIKAFNAMEAQLKGNTLPNHQNIREQLNKAVKTLVSVLNQNGKALSYSDAWRLIHLKSGMESVDTATAAQLQTALDHTIALIDQTLTPVQQSDTQLPKLLRRTVEKITLIEQVEAQLDQAIEQLTQFKTQITQTRYGTVDLKLYLNLAAAELETKQ